MMRFDVEFFGGALTGAAITIVLFFIFIK